MQTDYLINELTNIEYRLSVVINVLKQKNGIIEPEILDKLDSLNKLTVEV